jgi:hypothetical protein
MNRLACSVFLALIVTFPLSARREKPVLVVSCTADKANVTPRDSVNLTVSVENRGLSDVYMYRTLEWGWAGIGFTLTDSKGDVVRGAKHTIPLPPPPIYDKSQLVGLAPGYFFGTHMVFDFSHYTLSPGVYFIQVSYQSNYPKEEGFGLPILTSADGEFRSNKIQIEVSQR